MPEVFVIFCLTAAGSLVRLSLDFALQFFSRKMRRETVGSGPGRSEEASAPNDPLVAIGLTLTWYGALALGLVLSLPGDLVIERTWLAFALMGVGGLVGEICRARAPAIERHSRWDDAEAEDTLPDSVGLSTTLILVLNLAIAILCSGQGLVAIVPPSRPASQVEVSQAEAQLEPIIVVAARGSDPLAGSAPFL